MQQLPSSFKAFWGESRTVAKFLGMYQREAATGGRKRFSWVTARAVRPIWGLLLILASGLSAGAKTEAEISKSNPTSHSAGVLLSGGRQTNSVDRIEWTFQADGQLRIPDGRGLATPKTHVEAKLVFFERDLSSGSEATWGEKLGPGGLRWYETAEMTATIDGERVSSTLRPDRRLMVVQFWNWEGVLWCPQGPLTRAELDLIRQSAGVLLLDNLLPSRVVRPGEKWSLPEFPLASLLGLENVENATVEATLLEIVGDVARVEFVGKLHGAAEAVSSEIRLKGRYQFSLSKGRIIWLGLAYQESRPPGPIAPGVDLIAKIAITLRPESDCPQLQAQELAQIRTLGKPELHLEEESPDGFWRLKYERGWHITALTERMAILRLVDRGTFLAQCKISPANQRTRPQSLAQFQADIREALGKQFGQFLNASELRSSAGTPIYRVEVRGYAADVPVVWIHYWITSPSGEALVVSFTLEEVLRDRFADADKRLLNGLVLRADRVAARNQR
jgi:hypothetical protein